VDLSVDESAQDILPDPETGFEGMYASMEVFIAEPEQVLTNASDRACTPPLQLIKG
jgi:hypothetical protein